MAASKDHKSAEGRIRHAFWAGVWAAALALSTLLSPFDQFNWLLMARTAHLDASGEIGYIGAREDLSTPTQPERRRDLAIMLDRLREAGVDRVYVDVAFEASSEAAIDQRLNAALRAWNGRAFLVRSAVSGIDGQLQLSRSASTIGAGVPMIISHRWRNYLGYVWYMPLAVEIEGQRLQTLSASIAGGELTDGEFRINYGFDIETIPSYRFRDLARALDQNISQRDVAGELAGKTVVIGVTNRGNADAVNIPGQIDMPGSLVDIYAAETLKAGFTRSPDGLLLTVLALVLLCLLSQLQQPRWRYAGYAALCLLLPMLLYALALNGFITSGAGGAALLLIYAGMRAREAWKRNLRLVDDETGLPTFAALEAEKTVADTVPAIIVAKIHRFEEVRRTLPRQLHSEYVLRIIARLKAATQDSTIYLGQGHQIAWTMDEKEPALLKEHLEGLRALFASPLMVGNTQVDVGITFGVDITPSPNVARRVASAVAAAERTNETFEPIAIADSTSDEDLIWNISLQARIDAALANGEIFLVYQPKVDVKSGELVGVEALVRWLDPVKGHIPPDHFIRQCENAGRMGHLTRHVLVEGCRAGVAFGEHGMRVPMAINISATLLHERAIVRMVREVLVETGFDPRLLSLEITETYRISNLVRAAEILDELKGLGLAISMDDFGVGAASLEALLRLPFSELKIDRLFIAEITRNPKALGIVRHVLGLGDELRITVVAEGVEDAQTLNLLRESGCRVAQGFGIARPIPFDDILQFQQFDPETRIKNMV